MSLWDSQPAMSYSDWSLNAQARLDEMATVLDDLTRVGANFCERVQAGHLSDDDAMPHDKVIVSLLIRNILASVDAIGILMRSRTADPIAPQLRQVMELRLSLLWMLKEDRLIRARAYSVAQWLKELQTLESFLPGAGRQATILADASASDVVHATMSELPADEIGARIEQIKHVLSSEKYRELATDLSVKRRTAPWYSVLNGPANLRELCKGLDELGSYEFMYRELSAASHGQIAMRGLRFAGDAAHLIPLRLVESIPIHFLYAGITTFSALHRMAMVYGTSDDKLELFSLYKERIKERLFGLANTRFVSDGGAANSP